MALAEERERERVGDVCTAAFSKTHDPLPCTDVPAAPAAAAAARAMQILLLA